MLWVGVRCSDDLAAAHYRMEQAVLKKKRKNNLRIERQTFFLPLFSMKKIEFVSQFHAQAHAWQAHAQARSFQACAWASAQE